MRERKNISVEEYKNVCKKLGLTLEESTDSKIPGFLGIHAYVYSPIFKFGKDSIADLLIQDAHQDHPWVTYCNSVEKDDNYGNYIAIDKELTGCWNTPWDVDDFELQLRRTLDKIKEVEEKTKWPKRQHITIDVFYDQERDNRFLRQDLDEIVWKFFDDISDKVPVAVLNAAGNTYYAREDKI